MKRMKQFLAMLLVLTMSVGMLSGCGKSEETPAAAEATETTNNAEATEETGGASGGVLKLQWNQQKGIDTLIESPWTDAQCLLPYMLFDSLVAIESDGTIIGKLASDWTISEDALTYTFTIRDGVTWHDGEALTAEDVAWSWYAHAASGSSNGAAGVKKVAGYAEAADGSADTLAGITVDGNTVSITLAAPSRTFLADACIVKILPKHLLGDVPVTEVNTYEAFWSNPIGTGIYKIEEISYPDYCIVTANEDYFGEKAGIEKVQFTNYSAGGNDAVVAALISGDLDFAFKNAVNDIEVANNVVAQNPDVYAQMGTSNYSRYMVFNLGDRADGAVKDDLKEEKVRQAFNMIINQDAIASFYDGQAVGMSTMVNPGSASYNSDIPLPSQDIEGAKALLEEAGFDFSQTIDIAYYYDDQTTADVMAMVKQDFASAGVTVETSLMTGDLATQIYTDCNYDLLYCAYTPNDPIGLYIYFTSNSAYTYMGQKEERGALFDELYASWDASTDDATAKAIGDELQALGYQTCYIIPCYALNTIVMYNTKHVSVPEDIFAVDYENSRDWKFEEWKLVE